jgi:hypothetical protein
MCEEWMIGTLCWMWETLCRGPNRECGWRDASLSHKSLIQTRNPFKQNHKRWIKLSI